jgi:Zn-dependent protease
MTGAAAWLVSASGALVLFASVVAHELAHSLAALRSGLRISKITLFIFGGVAHMESEPRTPGVEFKMAVAGPLASIALGLGLGAVRFLALRPFPHSAPALVVEYAAYANAVLACFNLLPGFPLDGGRVLRSILWKVTGNFARSTAVAATIGRVIGLGVAFLGAMLAVAWEAPGFMWTVLVGSFMERLAFFSGQQVRPRYEPRRYEYVFIEEPAGADQTAPPDAGAGQ